MADSGFPVALQWDLGPEKLRQMKNKLLLYFGSLKKSNGGECVMEDTDCTKGHVLIHFTQETARERVLQKTDHEIAIAGEKLKLKVQRPENTENIQVPGAETEDRTDPAPTDIVRMTVSPNTERVPQRAGGETQDTGSLVLIENLPENYTPEMFTLLLENLTNKEENRDFQVEMVPEIRTAVVTFTCNIDLMDFIEKFHGTPRIRQLKLAAKLVEETRSVRVEGLPPNTAEEFIILYFESPKHGGGSVKDTRLVPEESAAIITFEDKGVTRTVLAMKHVLGRTEISVYPYYASLGITLYGNSGPPVTKPDPLEFPVSPYILEFILNDAQGKPNIEEKMATVHCDITWPSVTCPNPVMKLCLASKVSTHARTLVKIVPIWREKVSAEYKLLISKYKVAQFPVSEAVWEAVRRDVGSSAYPRVLLKPNLAKEKLFLAGFVKDVTQTEPVLGKLIEDTRQRIHRETHRETISEPLDPAFYEIMSRNDLLKNILKTSPDLIMNYDSSSRSLQFIGLKEEVSGAKSQILQMKQQLMSKRVPSVPHIIEFLQFADREEMSCALFIRANINAMFQVEGDAIKLTGFSARDLSEAEKIIKQELLCKKVTVTDKSLLKSTEWQSLDGSLQEAFNVETCRFLMADSPSGEEHQLVISGFSSTVENVYESISHFIQENTPMKKEMTVQSMAVAHFLRDENKSLQGDVEKMKVKFVINQRKITLHGSKSSVPEAAGLIESVLSSLYTDTLRIVKPGAKAFCKDNEDYYVTKAKSLFKCVIHLQKDGEGSAGDTNLDDPGDDPRLQMTISGGVTVAVYKGDLSQHRVDVVVNAANEDLKHIGGLALALSKAAGPKLQTDCDQIIKTKGKLSPGEPVMTDAGNLPCKHVIHTVGPKWDSSSQSKCERLLKKAIARSLDLAAEKGHRSIAIPAVSAGVYGFPLKRSVEIIIEAIREFAEDQGEKAGLKNIHLVDNKDEIITAFATVLRAGFGDQESDKDPERSTEWEVVKSSRGKADRGGNNDHFITNEGLTIRITPGNLQDATTDVIVNSVGKDLDLSSGGASRALLDKAGKALQDKLDAARGGSQVTEGSVFVTEGARLSCSSVIHTVTPAWDKTSNSSEKLLRRIVKMCLDTAESNRAQSISFPAIGTGNLGFPKDNVAALMFDEFLSFSSKNSFQYLQEVHVVLHPSDMGCITAFSQELTKLMESNAPQSKPSTKSSKAKGPGLFGTVTSPALGVHEMQIGSIVYQVKTGDITKEDTDVIVNSSNNTFNLKTGVSKAILEAAGQSVEDECAKLGSQSHKGHIITKAGNLLCKNILHVHLSKNTAENIKKCVTDVLHECEKLKLTSVAFPALGTGAAKVSSSDVSDTMLDALRSFTKSAHYVKKVKVVIFQQAMLNEFHASMKKREGSTPQKTSFLTTVWNYVSGVDEKEPEREGLELNEDIEPAIFHLCGESKESVKNTSTWLQDLIMKEQSENSIKNDWIKDFGDQELDKLRDLQKRLRVNMSFNPRESNIMLSGLTRDVLQMSTEIQTLINDLREKKNREWEAELCSNLVEWRYRDGSRSKQFDIMTNLELEKARTENRQSFSISIEGTTYTVNMEMKSASDSKGNSVTLERILKNEQSLELPAHWEPMDNDQPKMIALNPVDQEYSDVQTQFTKTCQMKIIKIERIQNRSLWLNYQIRKKTIDSRNGNTNNEKQLFHGTDVNTISQVNAHGFNRSFAGKNAACYGNGTYFAVNAIYSAHDTYSPPAGTNKYMYLARVITGVFCAGTQGMIAPSPKNPSNPTDLHDSMTDNMANPSMYVTFNDIQAYPEYLITFCK